MRVLITGAAGFGTSTLGEALSQRWNVQLLEADAYFWLQTQPPYTKRRMSEERSALLMQALAVNPVSVVAGSVMGWGNHVESTFNLIVFLYVSAEVRLQRLESREIRRFGRVDPAFLAWAARYDKGPKEGHSLEKHNSWLAPRECQVVRLVGN
jgi:cytidylate kinase